ncbi:MAG: hypothetical protein M1816_003344 [Peltula sp. TS41687]|nr:MAG: hypothetical protein M1816_003344 [Peltula sp. TS41687]
MSRFDVKPKRPLSKHVRLETPGKLRTEIESQVIADRLPSDLQYACHYWANHLENSKRQICDSDRVHNILREHFLHWLEALSLMGKMSESIALTGILLSRVVAGSTEVLPFLNDARRFVMRTWAIIEEAPLQTAYMHTGFKRHTKNLSKSNSHWDISGAKQRLVGHSGSMISVTFSPDGCKLASASHDGTARVWDVASGMAEQLLEVRVWDVTTGGPERVLEGHSGWVISVAISPDGSKLVSAFADKTVGVWNMTTGRAERTLDGHSDWVIIVAFSPDGSKVASEPFDRTVRIWDISTGQTTRILESHSDWVLSVAFSPDGNKLASGSADRTVRVRDLATYQTERILEGHSSGILNVAFSPDNSKLASGYDDETVCVWDITGQTKHILHGHSDSVFSVVFSLDSCMLASGSMDRIACLWDVSTPARS